MTSDSKSEKSVEEMKSDPVLEEESNKSEGEEEKPSSKKGRKREKKEVLPATPTSDRPTRERKVVERYTESSGARNASPKPLTFEKGRGTPLRDIPNVAFALSKKKADDNLQLLHTILFGRKSKPNMLKRNIGMFSGFVWTEIEEEKQRGKLKEKLDKCVKDKLFYFCEVLNIPASKTSSKKEELSAKILEFLEAPHSTTDVLLADKEKKGKRKTEKASAKKTSGKPAKKQKNSSAGEKPKSSSKSEDEEGDDTNEQSDSQEDSSGDDGGEMATKAESDQEQQLSSDEEGEEHVEPKKLKHSEINSSKKSTKNKEKSKALEEGSPVESPKRSNKRSSSSKPMKVASASKNAKKQKVEKADDEANENASSKSSAKVSKSDQGKGKSDKKATEEPSREEMHAVVVSILKKVDFNTATLSDILRQLGDHFGVDLMHRKAEVKAIITEAINNMTDEEDEDEDEGSEGESDHAKDEDNDDA